jgi:shikimate kinase
MGSGKTTIGNLLARHLGWHFVDLDTVIEQVAGEAITEIFKHRGEPAFRRIEREQLSAAMGRAGELERATVLALGGGTIVQPGNLELLRASGAAVVWLDCPLEELIARCALVTTRPLFRDAASFRALFEQRLPYYQQADYRVEATGPPREVVEQILSLDVFRANTGESAEDSTL